MRSITGLLAAIALFFMFSIVPLHAGNIVTNPGFETGDLTGWLFTPAGSGSLLIVGTEDGTHSGNYEADFGGVTSGSYDTISQVLATIPGQTYTFSFWLASDDGDDNGQQALWDGSLVLNLVNFGQSYTLYSFTETATSSSTSIAFAGYNPPAWNGLDDVSVDASTATPEPATMILLGVGGVVFGALRRRRPVR